MAANNLMATGLYTGDPNKQPESFAGTSRKPLSYAASTPMTTGLYAGDPNKQQETFSGTLHGKPWGLYNGYPNKQQQTSSGTPLSGASTEPNHATPTHWNPLTMSQYMTNQRNIIDPEYNSARNRLTEQYDAQRPTFQQGRNNADVYAAQGQRQLGNLRAQQGLYRSGNYQTGTANLWNQAATQKGALDRDQNLYTQQYANRMGELAQSQAGALSRAALGYEDYNLQAQQLQQAIAAQQNQQRQAEINSYIQLLLGQAQQTGKFTMPSKFDYGNRLVELLTAMRGGALGENNSNGHSWYTNTR